MKGFLLVLTLSIGASVAVCADLAAGVAAFERKDYQAAFQELEPLARQGIAPAEHYVGLMLSNGWGVEKDGPRAATLIRQAAEKGFANAQAVMGFAHVTGTWLVGVPESDTESFRWFMLAAKQGETTAQRQVGQRYEKGWGVKQDLVEAVKWYKLAADSGNAVALGNLGIMHLRGRGVPRDPDKGIQLMKTAVKQGNANIALMLAEVCMTGDGAPKDDVQAYAWAQIATTVQYPPNAKIAVELRNQIGESLTPAQRRKAEQLASLWSAPPIR